MTDNTKYLWELAIKEIVENTVTFEDDTTRVLTDKQLTYLITDEPKDLSATHILVTTTVVNEIIEELKGISILDTDAAILAILKVIEEHDIRRWELAPVLDDIFYKFKTILDLVTKSYNWLFNEAIGKAFGTYQEKKAPEYFFEDIRVSDMKRVKSL